MKRFNFRLNKLLQLREFYEHQAEVELAHAAAHKDSIELELKTVAQLKVHTGRKFNVESSAIDMNYLHAIQNYLLRLDKEKESLLEKLVIADEKVNEKRKTYIDAAAKRKVISKLKEKKITAWKKENIKAEENLIDDMVTFKSGKRLSKTDFFQEK